MIKTLTVIAALAAAPAMAETAFVGYSEWAVEAQTAEFGVGVNWTHGALSVTPQLIATYEDTNDFQFSSFELAAEYAVTDVVTAYATLETDDDFSYDELTVGVAVRY